MGDIDVVVHGCPKCLNVGFDLAGACAQSRGEEVLSRSFGQVFQVPKVSA